MQKIIIKIHKDVTREAEHHSRVQYQIEGNENARSKSE